MTNSQNPNVRVVDNGFIKDNHMFVAPSHITHLNSNQIYVYGSNEKGIMGAGAALYGYRQGWIEWGNGISPSKKSYPIPTKDHFLKVLSLDKIQQYVDKFKIYAKENPELEFLLTPIGCGLAGYTPEQIAPMFKDCPNNVFLPQCFIDIIQS